LGSWDILLRPAGTEDLEEICTIMLDTDPYTRLGYTEDTCLDTAISALEEGWAWVAVSSGKIVGFVLFRVFDGFPLGGYVRAIAVDETYRGRGVGSILLRVAEEKIFKYRRNVFLLVSSFNKDAQRFYRSRGYEVVGEIRDALVRGESEIIMRKRRP
jgi:ribosomal protein S18 acetylase RimI-like enzyme